jgi:hypothetical protein
MTNADRTSKNDLIAGQLPRAEREALVAAIAMRVQQVGDMPDLPAEEALWLLREINEQRNEIEQLRKTMKPVETPREHADAIDLLQANIHERDRRLLESNNLLRRAWMHAYSRAGLRVRDKHGHLYDDVEKKIREIGMGQMRLEEITPEEPSDYTKVPEVMNPPASAAQGAEARNLTRANVMGLEEVHRATEARPAKVVPLPSIGDPCPVCASGRIGQSQGNFRCGNCGWLGPSVPSPEKATAPPTRYAHTIGGMTPHPQGAWRRYSENGTAE